MKANWTGELIGKMHVHEVTYDDLAEELHCSKGYISMILNGGRTPVDGKERLNAAYNSVISKRKNTKNQVPKKGQDEKDGQ